MILIITVVLGGLLLLPYLYSQYSKRQREKARKKRRLPANVISERVAKWKPKPLIDFAVKKYPSPVINKGVTDVVSIDGYSKPALNFASSNFLGFSMRKELLDVSVESVDKYGVGSGGPRAFYGTFDSHINVEDTLAEYFDNEDCMCYSFCSVTMSSMLQSFVEKDDYLIADEYCSLPVQIGCNLSRPELSLFKHNDVSDLESKMKKVVEESGGLTIKSPQQKRFVVVEGVCPKTCGIIKDFDKIVKLCKKYKFYLLLDDSYAVGVLGKMGKGTCEHFGVDPKEVDMICGSCEYAFATSGGFCLGKALFIRYQRFFGNGYFFSCSGPPYCQDVMKKGIEILGKEHKELLSKLRLNVETLLLILRKGTTEMTEKGFVYVQGEEQVPLINLRFPKRTFDELKRWERLLLDRGLFVQVPVVGQEFWRRGSMDGLIRMSVSAAHSIEQIKKAGETMLAFLRDVME